jgi:hypothetical protein
MPAGCHLVNLLAPVFTPAVSGDADDSRYLFGIPNIYVSHGSDRAFGRSSANTRMSGIFKGAAHSNLI